MSIEDEIDDDMVARAMRGLGLSHGGEHPHGPCRYETIEAYKQWHVMRVRGKGYQERRELVRIVPTKEDATAMIRNLEKADREHRA